MQVDGAGWVPRTDDPDAVYDAVTTWVDQQGLSLYPHQDEAIIELLGGSNVVLATPTGSGKSLVAMAAHAAALAGGRVSFYTAPIKALVSEKFFAYCEIFGAANVGMLTGDASVNSDAPIICCTAEVLANIALREGPDADVGLVVMDEFHFYAEPDRGWAWQVPLLELTRAQFVLMSATLGDVSALAADLTRRNGRPTAIVDNAERPVPLVFSWAMTHLADTLAELIEERQAPVYVVHFTQAAAVEHATSLLAADPGVELTREARDAINERLVGFRFGAGFGKTLHKLVRRGIGVHHAGMLPRYRRLVEQLAQAGLLVVICGTDTLGVGINVPIRTVLFTGLAKFDGTRQRILRSREFMQIAGRAGRAGFDTVGYVVVQAPEHVIENAIALKKIGDDPKKQRGYRRKKAPDGEVVWSEETFDKLVSGTPEQLVSRMKVDNAMLINVVAREADAFPILRRLLTDNHESPRNQRRLARRALRLARSLVHSGVLTRLDEPDELGRRYVLTVDLPVDFALNQPLSHFALAAFDVLDPEADGVHAGPALGRGVRARGAAADPGPAAVRRPRHRGRRDEGRRDRVRRADGAPRRGHLADAAARAAGGDVRDLPRDPPVAARGRAVTEVGRPGDVRAGHELHRLRDPLPAGPLRGAGAALPHRRLPDAAADRPGPAPHPGARGALRVAGRDRAPDRLLAARRVGGAHRPRGGPPARPRAGRAPPAAQPATHLPAGAGVRRDDPQRDVPTGAARGPRRPGRADGAGAGGRRPHGPARVRW